MFDGFSLKNIRLVRDTKLVLSEDRNWATVGLHEFEFDSHRPTPLQSDLVTKLVSLTCVCLLNMNIQTGNHSYLGNLTVLF